MSDIEAASAIAATSKWWGHSLTIRGALLSAASAALPAIGAIVGLDLSGETLHQLGQQTVVVVQAVGGLAGMVLTVAGRVRASTQLERRTMQIQI